jgi:hypothetical protein
MSENFIYQNNKFTTKYKQVSENDEDLGVDSW